MAALANDGTAEPAGPINGRVRLDRDGAYDPYVQAAVAPGPNGRPRLRIRAPVEHTCRLLASPDFTNWWAPQIVNLPASTTEIEIRSPAAAGPEFYRIFAVGP